MRSRAHVALAAAAARIRQAAAAGTMALTVSRTRPADIVSLAVQRFERDVRRPLNAEEHCGPDLSTELASQCVG